MNHERLEDGPMKLGSDLMSPNGYAITLWLDAGGRFSGREGRKGEGPLRLYIGTLVRVQHTGELRQ